ncbi:MAG: ABC transporter permease [Bryobacterales bacterium]|nr:ABC transporter permease [Bryobacterales bacterium]
MGHDLRYAARQLANHPLATFVAMVSLALGIGANATIFTLLNKLVLESLPVPNPGGLVRITLTDAGQHDGEMPLSLAMFERIRDRQQSFSSVFGAADQIANLEVNKIRFVGGITEVTGEYFATLGLRPHLGRFFSPEDVALESDLPAPVAVLSHQCWVRRYRADPAVIGQAMRAGESAFTIVGVGPEGFGGLTVDAADDVFLPLGFAGRRDLRKPNDFSLTLLGRLQPGVSLPQARAQMESIWPGVRAESMPPELTGARRQQHEARGISLLPGATGSSYLRAIYERPLFVLMAMVGALLLIACVNLANLMLARVSTRRTEFAIRLSLGAPQWRLVRQLLVETLLLSAAGGLLGLLLAWHGAQALLNVMWQGLIPHTLNTEPNLRVLIFTAAATLATSLLCALLPARRLQPHGDASRSVRRGGFGAGRVLVPLQIALSLVLLIAAWQFSLSLHQLRSAPLGYRTEGVLMLKMYPLTGSEGQRMEGRAAYYRRVADGLRALPGVDAVSYSHMGPVRSYEVKLPASVSASAAAFAPVQAVFELTGPGFFDLVGMRVLAGREFTWKDTEGSPAVAVISESLARRLFPHGNAVGQRIDYGSKKNLEVVGVVNSASLWKPGSVEPPAVYRALLQEPDFNSSSVDVRVVGMPPESVAQAAQKLLESHGRHTALTIRTVAQEMDRLLMRERLTALLATFFAGVALLLAAIGLHGLMAQTVASRTAEIGVRAALGACPRDLRWLAVGGSLKLVLAGMAGGIPAGFAASRLIAAWVPGVAAVTAGSVAVAVVLLAVTAGLAAYYPAHRAASIDPVEALRQQ